MVTTFVHQSLTSFFPRFFQLFPTNIISPTFAKLSLSVFRNSRYLLGAFKVLSLGSMRKKCNTAQNLISAVDISENMEFRIMVVTCIRYWPEKSYEGEEESRTGIIHKRSKMI